MSAAAAASACLEGERESSIPDENEFTVNKEADLYTPLVQFLERQATEDEIPVVICPTHMLKARGQWHNPDITKIAIERYRHIRKTRVMVTTYEVKQFGKWNVGAVYEAASHHRFSHEAYVVLEWPKPVEFSLTDPTYKLDQIVRECQRHGVGLGTMKPHYAGFRLNVRLDPVPTTPTDADVDGWLDYVFLKIERARTTFEKQMNAEPDDR